MECTNFNLSLHGKPLHLAFIYRPPGSNINTFAAEPMDFIEANIKNRGIPIIIGDLNIHMNNSEGADTNTYLDILYSLDFTNWIQFQTHKSQNTIDLVISPKQSSVFSSVSQTPSLLRSLSCKFPYPTHYHKTSHQDDKVQETQFH